MLSRKSTHWHGIFLRLWLCLLYYHFYHHILYMQTFVELQENSENGVQQLCCTCLHFLHWNYCVFFLRAKQPCLPAGLGLLSYFCTRATSASADRMECQRLRYVFKRRKKRKTWRRRKKKVQERGKERKERGRERGKGEEERQRSNGGGRRCQSTNSSHTIGTGDRRRLRPPGSKPKLFATLNASPLSMLNNLLF